MRARYSRVRDVFASILAIVLHIKCTIVVIKFSGPLGSLNYMLLTFGNRDSLLCLAGEASMV